MRSSRVRLAVPTAEQSKASRFTRSAATGRSRRRKRLLSRAAVSLAGAGWAVFAAPGLSDRLPSAEASVQRVAYQTPLSSPLSNFFGGAPALGRLHLDWAHGGVVSSGQFQEDVQDLLPRYQAWFQQAGVRSGIDWRLLAAVGYQESNWNPKAVSPTGVRGIMMLTEGTADEMDVDREDPADSIQGGALYLQQIHDRLPPQIREPDRTWMALAAYNQGLGHLLDARALAAQIGGNPNRWKSVREALPLLADERWYPKTRHGYADGADAVSYVGNVSAYFQRLIAIAGAAAPATQTVSLRS